MDLKLCKDCRWATDIGGTPTVPFTCPDSLHGTIETYKGLIVANARNAI